MCGYRGPWRFYRTQVEKVKAVQQFLVGHMDENFTQEELSRRFDIPLTPLKNCFKFVFGASIGNYLLEYRMNRAAVFCGGIPPENGNDADGLPEPDTAVGMDISRREKVFVQSGRNGRGGAENRI